MGGAALKQAYTINADQVTINNTTIKRRRRAVLRPGSSRVEFSGHYGHGSPQAPDLHVEDLDVVDVAPHVVDLHGGCRQDGVDRRPDFSHQTSPSSDDARLETSASTSTVGDSATPSDPPVAVAERVPAPSPHGAGTPTPYYQDDLVTLYCGDTLELVDVWVGLDVMITDPPYGLQGLAGAYGTTQRTIANDMDTITRDTVLDLWGPKPIAVFGSPRLEDPPGGWSDRLVWDKAQPGMNGGPWRYAHESIFVRGDGWHRVGNSASSVMRYPSQANRRHVRDHIHSKPLQLLAQLVAAAPAGTIVDPFAGGGSTVAACVLLGRKVVAIELEESNCDVIIDRIQQRALDIDGGLL